MRIHKYIKSHKYKHAHSGQCRPGWQTTSVTPQAFINVEQASLVGGMTLFQLITINLGYCNMTRPSLMLVNNLFLPGLYRCESGPVDAQWHVHHKMKEAAQQNHRDTHQTKLDVSVAAMFLYSKHRKGDRACTVVWQWCSFWSLVFVCGNDMSTDPGNVNMNVILMPW